MVPSRILERVRALILLASNPSAQPEEARTAAFQACRLIVEYKIVLAIPKGEQPAVSKHAPSPGSGFAPSATEYGPFNPNFAADDFDHFQETLKEILKQRMEEERIRKAAERQERAHARAQETNVGRVCVCGRIKSPTQSECSTCHAVKESIRRKVKRTVEEVVTGKSRSQSSQKTTSYHQGVVDVFINGVKINKDFPEDF